MQDDAHPGVLGGHEGHTPKSCCPLRLILDVAYYVQLLQNREYLQHGLSNGKHR